MGSAVLNRLRWSSDEQLSPYESTAVLARAYAYLYGAGASLVLLTLALPQEAGRTDWPIYLVAGLAYAVVGLLLWRFERTPLAVFNGLPPLGTVLVSVVLIAGGGAGAAAYAMMYFWVVLAAHYFLSSRVAAANTAVAIAAYGGVLLLTPAVGAAALKWLMAAGALGVSGLLMSLLRARVAALFGRLAHHADQSDALAVFSRLALDPDEVGSLPAAATRLVHETFGADCANVLLLNDDEQGMRVVASDGWSRDVIGNVAVSARSDGLAGRALLSSRPLFTDEHPDLSRSPVLAEEGIVSSVLVPLRGRDEIYGLLAAHSRRKGAYGPAEAALLEPVAAVLAGALDRSRAADRLRHQAYHDDLTGLPNRQLFFDRLDGALARAREEGTTTAVLFLDIDNFKVLNDSLGHPAGDAVLVALVPRLRKALYLSDTIARFGGDEFVLLCEGVEGETAALAIAERIHAALEEPFAIGGAVHRLTASIGVSLGLAGAGAPEALLRDADAALARAKSAGRDRTALYDSGMHSGALARLRLENALRDALGLGQLRLAYQPIVDLETGRIVACEALLRWSHPELGEIAPAQMIPVAEETGVIVRIGEWVLGEACAAAAHWRTLAGDDAPGVTVNVSPRQLVEPALAAHVSRVLHHHALDPSRLVVEITEGVLIEENSSATDRLEQLRSLGVQLALDDFGTGYSSLSYLRRFDVDTVKIDRSFIATIDDGTGGDTIVGAVLGLTAGLGSRAVAEGIETVAQLQSLRALGCRYGQGYLFARPVSGPEIESLLASGGVISIADQASSSVA